MKKIRCVDQDSEQKLSFMKRVGMWGFLFFAAKGMMWLLVTFVLARYGMQ